MLFNREVELSRRGYIQRFQIELFINDKLGLEYEFTSSDDMIDCFGTFVIFDITESEDDILNKYLNYNKFQQ